MGSRVTPKLRRGAKVVYPAHGVGVIEKIEKLKDNGSTMSIYCIRIDDSGMTIRVPIANAERIGIRSVMAEKEVPKLLKILKSKKKTSNGLNWHKRQKSYIDKIKSGSLFELVEILRELTIIQARKELSFGEQRMYDNVRQLIVVEVAEAKGIDKTQASKLLDKAFT